MTSFRTAGFALWLLCAGLGACSSSTTKLTESDGGKAADLAVGSSLAIELPSTPGAPYHWVVEQADPTYLTESAPQVERQMQPERPGAPMLRTFTFQARKAGRTRVAFVYRAVGGATNPPERRFAVDVVIH